MNEVLVDTGPLVAYLDRGEIYHAWAVETFRGFTDPLWVCAAVLPRRVSFWPIFLPRNQQSEN